MQDIIELSDGWFLLGWWLLAVGGGWLSGRIRGALELPGDRDTGSRESVSPYDVAFLRDGGIWAGDAALFSLLHAGVVRVDEDGKLRRGSKPLPDDAPEIERYVLERAAGLDAESTPVLVLERAWTHHVERLQRLGLLPSKSVRLASRFAQGCVLAAIAVVAMTWLRHNATGLSLGVVALVASLALFGLVSVRVLRNTLRPTRSGRSVLARIDAAVDLPHSLKGWPAPDVPAAQISFVMIAFGFSAGLGGACRRYRNMLDGSPIADDERGPQSGYRADDAVLTGVARVPTKAELARVDRLAQGSVILFAVVTAVALHWMLSTAGPTGKGLRETPSFLVDAPILVPGPYGRRERPKPMPPAVRRHRSAACDPEAVARAEKSPLAMLAEIDRREREAEGPKPLTAEERAHRGVAGSLYGVTKDRLFEITLGERRVTTREVAPLLVAVAVLGPERALQEDEYFSVSVDALGFDRNGLLWATGDERLYYCSVATGICATQGILPPDAWSIWFADNPQGEEVLLASDVGFTTSLLQRLAVPSIFGPLASELLGRVELCAEPGPEAPPGLVAIAAGPVQKQGGVAVAVVRDEAALKLTFLQLGLAPGVVEQHRLPGELRPVAIVPTDRGVLLFGAQGAIHEWSCGEGLRKLTETGYEWRAAAGFQLELP